MATLSEVKAVQPGWFSRENKRFFKDASYKVLHGKTSRKPYLIRATYAWTDMFGGPARLHYRINPLDENLHIEPLVDKEFRGLEDVKDWLKTA